MKLAHNKFAKSKTR